MCIMNGQSYPLRGLLPPGTCPRGRCADCATTYTIEYGQAKGSQNFWTSANNDVTLGRVPKANKLDAWGTGSSWRPGRVGFSLFSLMSGHTLSRMDFRGIFQF